MGVVLVVIIIFVPEISHFFMGLENGKNYIMLSNLALPYLRSWSKIVIKRRQWFMRKSFCVFFLINFLFYEYIISNRHFQANIEA